MLEFAWLGITSLYQIPSAVEGWLDSVGLQGAQQHIQELTADAEINANRLAELAPSEECIEQTGQCGQVDGRVIHREPIGYLDRLNVQCPQSHPILNGIKYQVCDNTGRLVNGRCCGAKAIDKDVKRRRKPVEN